MASESELRQALEQHLAALPGLPPVAWENIDFEQDGAAFLKANYLPAESIAVGVEQGGSDVLAGIFQITVCAPKGDGWAQAAALVDTIRLHFQRGSVLTAGATRVALHKVWSNSPILSTSGNTGAGDNYYRVPVSVRVRGL